MHNHWYRIFIWLSVFLPALALSQKTANDYIKNSSIDKLAVNDSLIYYQCRVIKADVSVSSGEFTNLHSEQTITVTEKFVIHKYPDSVSVSYFKSDMYVFPNRKFSGLKIRERPYWNFKLYSHRLLTENEIAFLCGLEQTGKEANEYDFAITKYTRDEIIIKKGKKDYEQLVIKDGLSISQSLKF